MICLRKKRKKWISWFFGWKLGGFDIFRGQFLKIFKKTPQNLTSPVNIKCFNLKNHHQLKKKILSTKKWRQIYSSSGPTERYFINVKIVDRKSLMVLKYLCQICDTKFKSTVYLPSIHLVVAPYFSTEVAHIHWRPIYWHFATFYQWKAIFPDKCGDIPLLSCPDVHLKLITA